MLRCHTPGWDCVTNAAAVSVDALCCAGVGLNTRTGSARFIVALTMRLPAATLQKPTGELLKALLPAVRAERSAVTQRAFAGAIGALAKSASGKRLDWLVGEASGMFCNAGALMSTSPCTADAQRC